MLRSLKSVAVAYSGGVDSTLLLKVAVETLGAENVLAVTALSATYPARERADARSLAERVGARQVLIKTSELKDHNFRANPPERCFYCKKELFARLKKVAARHGIKAVVDGSNLDDAKDFRPGGRAKRLYDVTSPLAEAGFTKQEIRKLAKQWKLPNWNKPSQACLASRIPYGESITEERLVRIEKAEEAMKRLGFDPVRVRDYGRTARLEVAPDQLANLVKKRLAVVRHLKKCGYVYVTMDLEGFRSGSMNAMIPGCRLRK